MVNFLPCWFVSADKSKSPLAITRSPQSDTCASCCWIRTPPPRLKWWRPRPTAITTLAVTALPVANIHVLTSCMRSALTQITSEGGKGGGGYEDSGRNDKTVISKTFAMALLQEPHMSSGRSGTRDTTTNNGGDDDDKHLEYNTCDTCAQGDRDGDDLLFVQINNRPVLKGLPRRPFYRELSQRLWWLMKKNYTGNNSVVSDDDDNTTTGTSFLRPLVNAEELNMTENLPPPPFIPIQHPITAFSCQQWLHNMGEGGIRELLGLRHTVGTNISCLPPDYEALIKSAREPCKPNSKPPHLTVAARARSKHAHRGTEQFYGVVTGTTQKKNDDADLIVRDMLSDAVWINIHEFGGVNEPVVEMRNSKGYGVRWGGDWSTPEHPVNLTFRGFLEPHREDGFDNNWKH